MTKKRRTPKGIKQLGRNKFEIRIDYEDPRTGLRKERRNRGFRGTLTQAMEWKRREKARLVSTSGAQQRQRLSEYAAPWFEQKAATLDEPTIEKYGNDLNHILTVKIADMDGATIMMGDYYVDVLRPRHVRTAIAVWLQSFAGWSITNRVKLLRQIAKDAKADQLTEVYFCDRVELPPCNDYDEDNPNALIDQNGVAALFQALRERQPQWFALALVLTVTGLRWSQVTGLFWSDIDWQAGRIRLRRRNWKGRLLEIRTTTRRRKSKRRSTAMNPEVAEVLRAHQSQMMKEQHPGLASGLVFPTAKGTAHKGTPLRDVINRAVAAAELDVHLTTHGLRRTFVTLASQVGDREVVKSMVGHMTDRMHEHYRVVSAGQQAELQSNVLAMLRTGQKTGQDEDE